MPERPSSHNRYRDLHLPFSETPVLQPFTLAEKRVLKRDGYLIYSFSFQTIGSQIHAGKPFWYLFNGVDQQFKEVSSMVGEVAFIPNPKRFYLPGSDYKTFDEQTELIEEYGRVLREGLGLPDHIKAVMGKAADYAQLAFRHLEATGRYLFGKRYGYYLAQSRTPTGSVGIASVGRFDINEGGLAVESWGTDGTAPDVFVVPLVVSVAS